jgi:hypothetical protein
MKLSLEQVREQLEAHLPAMKNSYRAASCVRGNRQAMEWTELYILMDTTTSTPTVPLLCATAA